MCPLGVKTHPPVLIYLIFSCSRFWLSFLACLDAVIPSAEHKTRDGRGAEQCNQSGISQDSGDLWERRERRRGGGGG